MLNISRIDITFWKLEHMNREADAIFLISLKYWWAYKNIGISMKYP